MKKLSRLQKTILKMAYKNRVKYPNAKSDVSPREILVEYYGVPTFTDVSHFRRGAVVFLRRSVGINRHQAASVAVTKSFNRLAARGLAERIYGYGIKLTEEGIRIAKKLENLDL